MEDAVNDAPTTHPSLLVRLRDHQDQRAWAEFLAIYEPLVYRVARQMGFQEADCADLAQEVFRAVAGAIDRWDPDPASGSFRGWLFRIARNLALNFLARKKRGPVGSGDSDVKRQLEEYPAPSAEDSALFALEYRRQLFRWAVDQIRDEFTPATWKAFWRTSIDGIAPKEAAAELGLTVGAVYIARTRVMARVRRVINRLEGEQEEQPS